MNISLKAKKSVKVKSMSKTSPSKSNFLSSSSEKKKNMWNINSIFPFTGIFLCPNAKVNRWNNRWWIIHFIFLKRKLTFDKIFHVEIINTLFQLFLDKFLNRCSVLLEIHKIQIIGGVLIKWAYYSIGRTNRGSTVRMYWANFWHPTIHVQ